MRKRVPKICYRYIKSNDDSVNVENDTAVYTTKESAKEMLKKVTSDNLHLYSLYKVDAAQTYVWGRKRLLLKSSVMTRVTL